MTAMRIHPQCLSRALALALACSGGGALAQEMDHSQHPAHAPKKSEPAHDHAAMDHAAKATADSGQTNAHALHGEHAQHKEAEPAASVDHGNMDHGSHAGMDHAAMGHAKPAAASEPREPVPPLTDADRAAAFPAGMHGHELHGSPINAYFLFNRLEAFDADPGSGQAWEATGWIGGDVERLWLRSEGERRRGTTESADLELLYGRSISPWWDLVAGVRQDFKPGDSQTFAAIGVQGLAPQKFEISATAYVGERGQTAARLEAEYELLLTNRLILQPLVEIDLYGKDDPLRHVGAGLSTAEVGLRLRYEITRRFAPYVGLVHERAFGGTADYRRAHGESADETRLVVGLRAWF
jgi:copper resistance protein B